MKKTYNCNGAIINNEEYGETIELSGNKKDEVYNFLEEYKSTKNNFLDIIASASSYLLKTILLGSNEEYTKLKKSLSSTPESMMHSFETVLEREAPVDENHLPKEGSLEIKNSDRKLSDVFTNSENLSHTGGYSKNTYNVTYDVEYWKKIGNMYVTKNKKNKENKKYIINS